MRLIDADALKEAMNYNGACGICFRYVDDADTIDAVPVVHGRWEGNETCDAYDVVGVKTWAVKRKCSVCRFVHKFIEAHMCYEFCPNCGAKMDGDGDAR